MAPTPLLLFPCNGNALEALDALGDAFQVRAFVDDSPAKQGQSAHGHPVLGREAFERWPECAVLAVPGSPTSFRSRGQVIRDLGLDPSRFARVIHPRASVSPLARLGRNVLLLAGVVVTSNAEIGDDVCVLPNTVIHHDAAIGARTLIGANVTVAGSVTIGESCYVGSGTSIMNGLTIGAGALIGLGSNVIRDVAAESVVAGNPARRIVRSDSAH